jgi:hypothetical protein
MLKHFLFISFLLVSLYAGAQTDSAPARAVQQTPRPRVRDTAAAVKREVARVRKDTARVTRDTARARSVVVAPDTAKRAADSLAGLIPVAAPVQKQRLSWQQDTLFRRIYQVNYLPVNEKPVFMITAVWVRESRDYLFYLLTGLVLFMAFLKATFPRYFQHIFKMLFQTSFRQKQTREQLAGSQMPSLLMNLLFVLVAGVFISVVATQKNLTGLSFWSLFFYSVLVLIIVYTIKFLFLRFTGWIFHVAEASETYVFIVFLVNKLLGVILLPLLWLITFSEGNMHVVALTVAFFIIGFLLVYRYILSLASVRDMLRVSAFHFFIYLCGVEILPIILIYKIVFNKTGFTI